MDAIEAYEIFSELYNSRLSDAGARIWVAAVKDIPPTLLEHATAEYIKAGKFFPRPSELRELALQGGNLIKDFSAHVEPDKLSPFVRASHALEDNFYHLGIYDAEGWKMLLDSVGPDRPDLNAHVQKKIRQLEALCKSN